MRKLPIALLLLICCGCFGPFARRQPSAWLSGPPTLQVRFDSASASASLRWERAPERDFRYYEVQRGTERGDFAALALFEAVDDTLFVDEGLLADAVYRYRVQSYFGEGETIHALQSTVVEGGIHRRVESWSAGSGFRPTRLVVGQQGTLFAVGAGSAKVARFDRAGHFLGALVFAREELALLETGVLDGPSLALDSGGNLYVTYNLRHSERGPEAFWSKFDTDGRLLWTRPLEGLFARHIAIDEEDQIFIESISQLQQFNTEGERRTQHSVPALLVASLRFWSGRFAALIEPVSLTEADWQAPRLVVYEGADRRQTARVVGRDPKSELDRGDGLLRRPTDFAVDEATARSFVINAGLDRVEVFHEERFLTRWGESGDAPGHFRFSGKADVVEEMSSGRLVERAVVAGGIARDAEGYIYVADTFNNRIQKFQP